MGNELSFTPSKDRVNKSQNEACETEKSQGSFLFFICSYFSLSFLVVSELLVCKSFKDNKILKMTSTEETDGMLAAGTIILVDQLQDLGINAGDITKLKAAGIYSVSV